MSNSDENSILEFLAGYSGSFVSIVEVSKRADGRRRFETEPDWARLVLLHLEKAGFLESDAYGHVRLKPGAAALRKHRSDRERLQEEKVKTYVLKMTDASDDKPFPQMLREIATSFYTNDLDSDKSA